ncbi:F-box protein-like protein [Tanacetum coccineum]
MATSLTDINLDIIQTQILPRLDGPSLTNTSAVSSELQSLCSDDDLWSPIAKSTWPSITDPRVDNIISTFPGGHRSFYKDSFPALFTGVSHSNRFCSLSSSSQQPQPDCWLTELISVVDIRYKDDIIYSKVEVTPTTSIFLSSSLWIDLLDHHTSNLFASIPLPRISPCIDLKVDPFAGPDQATLSHFKESVTLNWIIIHPTLKRSGNVSSIKPVSVSKDWMTNDIIVVQYATVLPGPDPNEMVQCRIRVVIGVEFHVKEVILLIQDSNSRLLNGRDFMVTVKGAIMGKHNVRRKMVDDETRLRSYKEFEDMKREKNEQLASFRPNSQQPQPDCWLTELISVVDIRYHDDIFYSKVEVTPTTSNFFSSTLWIDLLDLHTSNPFASKPLPRISPCIDLKVDPVTGPDQATLSHVKESVTLNWIIIHPTLKWSGNISSIKPVSVSKDWMTNDIVVQYATVLPRPGPNEMVQCRIRVVFGVEFHLKEVILIIQESNSCLMNGRDFMVAVKGAIMGKHNVRRKMVDDETRLRIYKEFEDMKREKSEQVKKRERRRNFAVKIVLTNLNVY